MAKIVHEYVRVDEADHRYTEDSNWVFQCIVWDLDDHYIVDIAEARDMETLEE